MMMRLALLSAVLAVGAPVYAQQPPAPQAPPAEEQAITFEEQVVVTASRSEQQLVNAPAAVSLVTTQTIQNSPATNVGDLLRSVPGVNVMQTSARDFNITARGATSTLSTSQLALVDGRSVYLDFFGMVMWDLVPSSPQDIRQIEVIRGPASAVWGANAMTGVVNVITKTPRELAAARGSTFTVGVGAFNRNVSGRDQDTGSLFYVNGSHAEAVDERWAFKLSAGYFTQDPLPRPVGTHSQRVQHAVSAIHQPGDVTAQVRRPRRLRHPGRRFRRRERRRGGHRRAHLRRSGPVRYLQRHADGLLRAPAIRTAAAGSASSRTCSTAMR